CLMEMLGTKFNSTIRYDWNIMNVLKNKDGFFMGSGSISNGSSEQGNAIYSSGISGSCIMFCDSEDGYFGENNGVIKIFLRDLATWTSPFKNGTWAMLWAIFTIVALIEYWTVKKRTKMQSVFETFRVLVKQERLIENS